MAILRPVLFIACLFFIPCISGCDPITRHKVLTTLIDGIPSLPPPEQICEEYAEKKIAADLAARTGQSQIGSAAGVDKGSAHPPYQEKLCDDCHDKTKPGGLILPKNEICFKCHKNFIKGRYVHGPVAVGNCLTCHLPHNSSFPSLLKTGKAELCATCHREKRVASGMHDKLKEKHLVCVDCHDPHFGNVDYFLK
jgi:predicted CXXCH cytochrome family protein